MHITSLPSPYGIGSMGKSAFDFIDFLKKAGQTYWQILPINPPGYGDSPYQAFSTFAGNPYLIDLDQLVQNGWQAAGLAQSEAGTATAVSLIFLSAVLTALSLYGKIAKLAGAGTLVPITGFANSVVSPAMEFRAEGFITGTAVKMFTIAGPVIVYGTVASVVYGMIYWFFTQVI